MEGTDIQQIDTDNTHNHTYFGNGGNNQVTVAGPTNLTTTYDNEGQSIGTYYNFQAATSGTGATVSTANANSPDTFCPLGWQLPYSGKGGDYYDQSRSWNYLLATYGIDTAIDDETQTQKFRSYPFSVIYAGNYNWETGTLAYFQVHTLLHASTVSGVNGSYQMYAWEKKISANANNSKLYGNAVRCVTRK